MNYKYDLAIIGGGAAGLTAVRFAPKLGARVAFIEKDRIGGDCTWKGCVPSKTLIKAAKVAYQMRTADRFGLAPVEVSVDLKPVMEHVQKVVREVYSRETPEVFQKQGIDVFQGDAHFIDSHSLSVGSGQLSANYILICTGANPFVPPISGLDQTPYLTYQNIWNLETLPRRLIVVGGGPIGCEMAQGFNRLGSQVSVVEGGEKFSNEPEASRVIMDTFRLEGVDYHSNAMAERVWREGTEIHLTAGAKEIVGDVLLMAVGRRPNINGLDLEKAGVTYSDKGVRVDKYLRTSQKHIFAAGDCTGGYQFSHYAGWQAFIAVRNALLPGDSTGISEKVPWTVFTDPEVAHLGLNEAQARKIIGDEVAVGIWPMKKVDRALSEGEEKGFLKLVYKQDRTLLGVTIVAAEAGEMINEWVIAMERNFKVDEIASSIHVYPTYSSVSMQASSSILVKSLLTGLKGEVIKRLAHISHRDRAGEINV